MIVSRGGVLDVRQPAGARAVRHRAEDLGRPFQDLELSYRPIELRAPVDEALRERRRVAVGEVRVRAAQGRRAALDVTVAPLLSATASGAIGVEHRLRGRQPLRRACSSELEGNRRDLELAYEELQSTIDELETTNEELQSANEELQTTNEELQSTNEELETMNEELQSTNEELETINDELRDRTAELNRVNEFLEAILTSLGHRRRGRRSPAARAGLEHRAEDLWGLRQDEAVEHHLLSLDIGLPTEQLAGALRAVLGGASDREDTRSAAVNRRGRTIECATTILPLRLDAADGDGEVVRGAIVLMEDGAVATGRRRPDGRPDGSAAPVVSASRGSGARSSPTARPAAAREARTRRASARPASRPARAAARRPRP